jgi:hypothetical protein
MIVTKLSNVPLFLLKLKLLAWYPQEEYNIDMIASQQKHKLRLQNSSCYIIGVVTLWNKNQMLKLSTVKF